MRVALNGWFWNHPETGSGQYTRRLVQALESVDPQLSLKVLLPSDSPLGSLDEGRATDFVVHPIRRTNLHKLWWEQVLVPRLAERVNADVIHAPYWAPPCAAPLPVVVTVHDIIPLLLPDYRGGLLVRLYTSLVAAATSRAQVVLADSDATRRDILEHIEVRPDQVRTVYLALNDDLTPEPQPEDAEIRKRLKLPSGYILYFGGFDARKNLAGALESFAIVHGAIPDAVLVLAGRLPEADNAFTPDPRRLAQALELPAEAIRYLGFVSEADKAAVYRGARVFLFPSLYEGFGYPPLEALSCGVPVVGSASSSLPEVVDDGGILLDPHDTEGMAGALMQILIEDAYYGELREAAIKQSRRFSWERTATDTLAAYRTALRRVPPA
ncbi:MAG: glycosyltransferase family 4 protein [Anaerolineae bacterium]